MFMLSTKGDGRVAQFEVRDDQNTNWNFHLEASERQSDARVMLFLEKIPKV